MNTLETTLKKILEASYTTEEIRNPLEESIEGIERHKSEGIYDE